jgi:hypothetical protein
MAPILGIYASQISGHLFAPSGAYDSIATTTVGSGGTASVTFSSISQTYTHLQIRWLMRSNRATGFNDALRVRFNSDTGSNYSNHLLYGDGTGAYADAGTNTTSMPLGYGSSNNNIASSFGAGVIDILDYANTSKYTTGRGLTGLSTNGAGDETIGLASGSWRNLNAVTSITIFPGTGTLFNEYSSFALYGIKGN